VATTEGTTTPPESEWAMMTRNPSTASRRPVPARRPAAFAQCVRKHGFPQFPDPLTTESPAGNFMLGPGMYFPVNRGYQVQSAAFLRAAKVCGVQLP
jgi:hypothetical protein